MNSRWLAALLMAVPASLTLAADAPAPAPKDAPAAKTEAAPKADAPKESAEEKEVKSRFSYLQGVLSGRELFRSKDQYGVDVDQFLKGLNEGATGKSDVSMAEVSKLRNKLILLQIDKQLAKAEIAKDTGEVTMLKEERKRFQEVYDRLIATDDFLKKNKTAEGVKTTASGLQYKVIKEGTGPKPGPADIFTANYKGTLLDGKVFDESKPNSPLKLGVNQVIPGWTEGLQLMPVGSKYIFWIPSELGYGESGTQGIPPSSLLIFEVELLGAEAPPVPGAMPMGIQNKPQQ